MSRRKKRHDAVDRTSGSGRAFGLALALTTLSGASGLSHEVLWTRRLTDLLGTSGEASSRVFGGFFLGLSLGAAWASSRAGTADRPWRATAVAEVAVAVLALPILLLPEWTGWIWPALGPEGLTGWPGWLAKWVVSLLVVVPPAAAMGVVLPQLSAAALRGPRRLDRHGVWLYAANTLGGVAGLAATVLIALPTLGVSGSMVLAMSTNLGLAGILLLTDRGAPVSRAEEPVRTQDEVRPGRRYVPAAMAFGSGAGVLAAEVVGLEQVMLAAPLSIYAPAAILTAVILSLGLAALAVPSLRRRDDSSASRLLFLLGAAGVTVTATPLLFMALASAAGPLAGASSLNGFFLRLVVISSIALGPAFFLLGQVFPEAIAVSGAAITPGDGARRLGRLLAWNGLGGFLGAESANRVLVPFCGVHGGMAAVGLFYLLAGLGVAVRTSSWRDFRPVVRPAAACLIGSALAFGLVRKLPHVNPNLGFSVLEQRFGREGTVAVVESPSGARSILLSNQYVLGGTDARWDQERQAHLPLLLHPGPRRVAFIGLATGITPGAALEHKSVESITVVEVSPLVVDTADRWFSEWNHSVIRSRPTQVLVEDGRTYLAACADRFDVVIGDLYLPWGPGESRLFTVEHYAAARRALRSGGLFCQWLPMYQLTPDQFDTILASFSRAFPRVHLLRNSFGVGRPALALIGFRESDLDWNLVDRRSGEARASGAIRDPVVRHAETVAMLYLGRADPADESAPINTLGNLSLELAAGRERVTGNPGAKYLYGERWLSWIKSRLAAHPAELPSVPVGPTRGSVADLMLLGLRISQQERSRLGVRSEAHRADHQLPVELIEQLPPTIVTDHGADWSRWPGTQTPSRGPR